jgi:predicted dehydrogenase
MGMPCRVNANIGFGRHHRIEVEDDVTAILDYTGGMTGILNLSTGEAPGVNRIEIAGTRGLLRLENGNLELFRNEADSVEVCRFSKEHSGKPTAHKEVFTFDTINDPFQAMYVNFKDAILNGAVLTAPAVDAYKPLELANALLLSGFLGRPVEIPIDGNLYLAELEKRK